MEIGERKRGSVRGANVFFKIAWNGLSYAKNDSTTFRVFKPNQPQNALGY